MRPMVYTAKILSCPWLQRTWNKAQLATPMSRAHVSSLTEHEPSLPSSGCRLPPLLIALLPGVQPHFLSPEKTEASFLILYIEFI